MPSNEYYHPSTVYLLLSSFIYLFSPYPKIYSNANLISSSSSSLSLLYEGGINITSDMSHEQRLFYTLMTGYEKAVRPIRNSSEPIVIRLGISLTQILDIVSNIRKYMQLIQYVCLYRTNEIKL